MKDRVSHMEGVFRRDKAVPKKLRAFHEVMNAGLRWPAIAELYQRVTREFAVEDSFEKVLELFAPGSSENGETEVSLTVEALRDIPLVEVRQTMSLLSRAVVNLKRLADERDAQ